MSIPALATAGEERPKELRELSVAAKRYFLAQCKKDPKAAAFDSVAILERAAKKFGYAPRERGGFVKVPCALLRHPDLSSVERDVAIQFMSYAYEGMDRSWPSEQSIANEIGCTVATVSRAKKKLVALGLLKIAQKRFRESTIYDVSALQNL
jgi:hypothetical protein